ncbi:MAG: recombinase family protein, partial [Chitinophagaceae bacterium]
MKRAILMSRVSSDEQAKGYSLDIQVEKLSEHCRRENIAVVNIFKEDHSAKNFNRPEFKKLLQYLKANKGKVDLLLVSTWDRFSRNLTESFAMIDRLKNLGVEVQAIEQPLDLSVPENLMILSVYLALPDIDNKRRSIKITEGVRAAKLSGRWLGLAPYGYKNARDENNKPIIIPGEKAATVKKIFSLIAGGKTQAEVKEHFKKQGITFAKTTFSEMLRNQVYIGNIRVESESGSYYV